MPKSIRDAFKNQSGVRIDPNFNRAEVEIAKAMSSCRDCGKDSKGCIYCNECGKNHPYDYALDDFNFDAARERGGR